VGQPLRTISYRELCNHRGADGNSDVIEPVVPKRRVPIRGEGTDRTAAVANGLESAGARAWKSEMDYSGKGGSFKWGWRQMKSPHSKGTEECMLDGNNDRTAPRNQGSFALPYLISPTMIN